MTRYINMYNQKLHQTLKGYVKDNSVIVHNLKEELKLLENKEKYLRSMSLQSQTNINEISDMSRIWELSSDEHQLNEKVLSNMESMLSQCELISANQEATAMMHMAIIENIADDSDEENEVDPNKKKVENVVVKKQWNMEGKVDKISYAMVFDTVSSSEDQDEFNDFILDIKLSTENNDLELFKQSVLDSGDMQTFTLQLHNYQILVRERNEAMDELEDFENMEVQRSANPVQFLFTPVKDFDFMVLWNVVWDNRNNCFKNKIWIDCTDDVTARFSQKADAFPFLNGSKALRNKKQVIQFFGYFVEELIESTLDK